jgi:hypothetical protein
MLLDMPILKGYQHVIVDERVCTGLRYVSKKFAQTKFWNCISKPKKLGKGKQKWMKTCISASLKLRKLNTLVNIR